MTIIFDIVDGLSNDVLVASSLYLFALIAQDLDVHDIYAVIFAEMAMLSLSNLDVIVDGVLFTG